MRRRHVHVQAGQSYSHGRRILRGVLEFAARLQVPWRVTWGEDVLHMGMDALDGAIMPVLGPDGQALARRLRRAGVPVVNVSGALARPGLPTVISDNAAIGRLAGEHLTTRLYRRFAFVGMPGQHYSRLRRAGFLRAAGVRECPEPSDPGSRTLMAFLRRLEPGTAIFAVNDSAARRVMEAAEASGRRIPDELAVLGVDVEEEIGAALGSRLSSVDPDSARVGREAAALLERLMDGATPPGQPRLIPPAGVVGKESTRIPSGADPRLTAALRIIAERACGGLDVPGVLAATGTGRRTLETLFRRELGEGIDAVIRRQRIERAADLLRNSPLSISEVASRAGFADAYYFSHAFKKTTGESPSRWRRRVRGG